MRVALFGCRFAVVNVSGGMHVTELAGKTALECAALYVIGNVSWIAPAFAPVSFIRASGRCG